MSIYVMFGVTALNVDYKGGIIPVDISSDYAKKDGFSRPFLRRNEVC